MADDLSFTKNFGKFHHNSHISYLLSKSKLGLGQNPGKDWFNTIKKFYEELDGIPEISLVLRVLEHTENLEVIFDFEASSILDLDPTQSSSTSGSCDYKTGRLYLGAKHDFGAALGTLAHEFTHLAVQIVYDNECNPYGIEDAQTKSDFAEIIEECRLKPEGDPIVKRVFTAYKNPEDWASELIVRVPHLLAYYYDERDDAILSGLEEDFRGLFEFFRVKILPDLLRFIEEPGRVKIGHKIRRLNSFLGELPAIRSAPISLRNFKINLVPNDLETALVLVTNSPNLAKINLLHTLEGIPCIFAKISDFASGRSAGEICQAALSELAPILVVDCSRDYGLGGDDFWNFFNSKIRLILITNPKENWLNQNEDHKVRRLDYHWDDLTEDSQRILLQTRDINFQGKSIKFDQILQRNSRLCHEFLDKMLNQNEDIVIGEPPAVFDGDYYYIERKLIVAQIEANFPAELIRNPPSRMMVISDEVGVGKTTILKHISKEVKDIFPNFWVVRLNLMDFAEIFEEFLKKRVQILQLLLQILTFNNGAESELFIELLRSKRVIFLLDSFDELDPVHKPIIIEILQYLDQIKLDQIWITTRFYSEHNFGRLFKMTSCYLEPLTLNDQLDYLSDYWRKFLGVPPDQDALNLKIFAEALLEGISLTINDNQLEFTSTPLHLHMLAAAFEEEIQEFAESTKINVPIHLDLLDLYEKFIDRKYIGYVLHDRDSRDIAEMLAGGVNLRKVHQFLALDVLYPRHKHDFPQPKRFHALPPEKLNKIGIAEYIGTKPRFIHRTFAEYFVADLLTDRLTKEHSHLDSFQIIFLDKILLGDESRVVRSFLERLLERNPPCSEHLQRYGRKMVELHQQNRNGESTNPKFKLLERDGFKSDSPIPVIADFDAKIYQNWHDTRKPIHDLVGTILHRLVRENRSNILDFLLNSLEQVDGRLWSDLFLRENAWGQTVWHGACIKGDLKILRKLLKVILRNSVISDEDIRKKILSSKDHESRNPWQWIALHNNLNLLEIAENLAENHHLNLQEDLFLAKDNLGCNLAHWMFHYATSPSLNRFYSLAKSAQIDLKSFLHSADNSGRNVWHYAVWNQNPNILEKLWSISQEFGLDFPPDILYKSNLIQSGSLESLETTWSLIKRSQIDLKSFFAYPSANPLHLAAENVDQKILPKLLDYIKEADPGYNLLKTLSFTKYGNHNLWSLILVNNDFDRFRLVWSFFKSHQLFWAELEEILFKPDDDGSGRIWQDALCKGRPEFVELLREIAEDIGVDLKK